MEDVALYVSGSTLKLTFVIIYRPGSAPASSVFIDEFSDVMERTVTYSAYLIIAGDVNIHLDNQGLNMTKDFNQILKDFDLCQTVKEPTHVAGHILDVVIVRRGSTSIDVTVDPPMISDHSLITVGIGDDKDILRPRNVSACRCKNFNTDEFKNDLAISDLLINPPDEAQSLLFGYNKTLTDLLDKHAPSRRVLRSSRAKSPWYNAESPRMKAETRRLEKIYRRTKSAEDRRTTS